MVATTVARRAEERAGIDAADRLMASNPAGRSCGLCGGTGWVPEWGQSCPSDRHRSELELIWWAFADGFEQLAAARRRRRDRAAG